MSRNFNICTAVSMELDQTSKLARAQFLMTNDENYKSNYGCLCLFIMSYDEH